MGELEPLRDGIIKASQGLFNIYHCYTPFTEDEEIHYWADDNINAFLTVAKNMEAQLLYMYVSVAETVRPGEIEDIQIGFYYEDRLHLFSQSASWQQSEDDEQ
jgi:hypothetical protein